MNTVSASTAPALIPGRDASAGILLLPWRFRYQKAYIKSPEQLEPTENVRRTTASAIHNTQWGAGHYVASTLVWGMNKHVENGHAGTASHSLLAETNVQLGRPAVYGRYEFVQKSQGELEIPATSLHAATGHGNTYNVHALTLGANYRLAQVAKADLTLGAQGSIFRPDGALRPYYGKAPVAAEVYLRINPSVLQMKM